MNTRRSFLTSLLSSIAGTLAAGSLLFTRRAEASECECDCEEVDELAKKYGGPPAKKYGGPPAKKYGGPPTTKYGGPPKPRDRR